MKEAKIIKLNRTGNAIRNILFGFIDKLVTLVFPFVIRTILIRVLGIDYAGLDGLFVSILEVLSLSELGLSTAIVYCMYKPIAQGDDQTICAILKLFRKMYFIIGVVIFVIGMLIMPFLECFIKESYPTGINLYILFFVFLINSCISYFFGGYRSSILSAYQRVDVIRKISTIAKGSMYVLQIIALFLCKNYYLYVIMMPIFTIIMNLITAYEAKKMFPQYECVGDVSNEVKIDLKEKISGLMITKLCVITRNSFDNIFVSSFLGLSMAAIYSNYYFIIKSIISILGIIVQSVTAGIGNSIQTESTEHNYMDLRRFNFMYLWISGICTVCLLCLFQPFMCLWAGDNNLLPMNSVILFCVYFFVLTMGDMQSTYCNAAGLWWHYKNCTLFEALLNLVLNFVLGKIWGLNGIIAGTLISLFFVNFLYSERLVFKYYFKNGKTKEFYLLQFRCAFTTVFMCIITYNICLWIEHVIGLNNIVMIIIFRLIICIVLSNALYYLCYKKVEEFNSAYAWGINKIIKHEK